MLIIHATQKLLNTSRLSTSLYISQASEGQTLHSWYCDLLPTGFAGKLLVMYVHEPSLLTIVCRGKTLAGTWEEFTHRLPMLLKKYNFQPSFIARETNYINEYVVSKTNSRSMLSYINSMKYGLEFRCKSADRYDNIQQDLLEESIMGYPYQSRINKNRYTSAIEYWKEQKVLLHGNNPDQ